MDYNKAFRSISLCAPVEGVLQSTFTLGAQKMTILTIWNVCGPQYIRSRGVDTRAAIATPDATVVPVGGCSELAGTVGRLAPTRHTHPLGAVHETRHPVWQGDGRVDGGLAVRNTVQLAGVNSKVVNVLCIIHSIIIVTVDDCLQGIF